MVQRRSMYNRNMLFAEMQLEVNIAMTYQNAR